MPEILWKKLTKEQIVSILDESTSISDLTKRLGYKTRNSKTRKQIDNMLEFYNLKLPTYERSKLTTQRVEEKVCPICERTFTIETIAQRTRKYCYECSPATNNPTAKTRAMKNKVIEMKGGKCKKCGYNKCIDALELHHLDPSTKDYQLSNTGGAPSFEKFLAEADKCILLCANCHREEHWRLRQENNAED